MNKLRLVNDLLSLTTSVELNQYTHIRVTGVSKRIVVEYERADNHFNINDDMAMIMTVCNRLLLNCKIEKDKLTITEY